MTFSLFACTFLFKKTFPIHIKNNKRDYSNVQTQQHGLDQGLQSSLGPFLIVYQQSFNPAAGPTQATTAEADGTGYSTSGTHCPALLWFAIYL